MSNHGDPKSPALPPPSPDALDTDYDDREEVFLAEVRAERDPKKLRAWADTTYVAQALAVLSNPNADASVLEAFVLGHPGIDLSLLDHPHCPPTVVDELMLSAWTEVRKHAHTRYQERRRREMEQMAEPSEQPTEPVMKGLARKEEGRMAPTPVRPWTSKPNAAGDFADWLNDDNVRPFLDEDMPAAMYAMVPTYEEAFFDLSEAGTAAYLVADPVDDGPDPTYVLENVVVRHPRCPRQLLDRVATKLVSAVALLKPLKFDDAFRTKPDGTPQRLPDAIPAVVSAVQALVGHPELKNTYLKELLNSEVPEIRNLVALSPKARVTDLQELLKSATAYRYLAEHPSKRVRDVEKNLLGQFGGEGYPRGSTLSVRGFLARNPHVSDAALNALKASGTPQELRGLAANPNLDTKFRLHLAQTQQDPEIHKALAKNENAPAQVLEAWADHTDPHMRAIVAANPSTPKAVLAARVTTEKDHHVLDALASNPRLPESAIRVLFARGHLNGLAKNPRLPPDLQKAIADGPDPQARYHLAQNPRADERLLWLLVDPSRRESYNMNEVERTNQRRIERAVARHPNAPSEVLKYLEFSSDPKTRIAAKVGLFAAAT